MSYVIQCDFCGLSGEPEGRKYASPNQWREFRINEGHTVQNEQTLHACPACEAKHLWPRQQTATMEDLIKVLRELARVMADRKPKPK